MGSLTKAGVAHVKLLQYILPSSSCSGSFLLLEKPITQVVFIPRAVLKEH